jgi:hypothetical protein
MVNAARAFLKDNDIVCIPSEDNRVNALGNKLKEFRKDSTKRFKDAEDGKVIPIAHGK